MTQQKLPIGRPRRPKAKRDMFGARGNKHMVGQVKERGLWRRDVHTFGMNVATATSGDSGYMSILGAPGAGFTRQVRRVSIHGAIALIPTSTSETLENVGGVLEFQLGLAEDLPAFQAMQRDSSAPGLFRRYVTFAQSAGVFHFWLPSGFDQQGQGSALPSGGPLGIFVGVTAKSMTDGGFYLQVYGLISTQEKEERVYG